MTSHASLHTVPHCPPTQYSTRPSSMEAPSTRRTCPSSHTPGSQTHYKSVPLAYKILTRATCRTWRANHPYIHGVVTSRRWRWVLQALCKFLFLSSAVETFKVNWQGSVARKVHRLSCGKEIKSCSFKSSQPKTKMKSNLESSCLSLSSDQHKPLVHLCRPNLCCRSFPNLHLCRSPAFLLHCACHQPA